MVMFDEKTLFGENLGIHSSQIGEHLSILKGEEKFFSL